MSALPWILAGIGLLGGFLQGLFGGRGSGGYIPPPTPAQPHQPVGLGGVSMLPLIFSTPSPISNLPAQIVAQALSTPSRQRKSEELSAFTTGQPLVLPSPQFSLLGQPRLYSPQELASTLGFLPPPFSFQFFNPASFLGSMFIR